MIPDAHLLMLHAALLQHEPRAEDRFAQAIRPRLDRLLRSRNPLLPHDLLDDAAVDALLALFKAPEKFAPARGSLLNYLLLIAERRVRDTLRRLSCRFQHEKTFGSVEDVELELAGANQPVNAAPAPEPGADPDTLPPEVEALLAAILPDPADRRLLELAGEGRTSVAEFAALLGLSGLPPDEQAKQVKRHRDRVVARVRRKRREFKRLLYDD